MWSCGSTLKRKLPRLEWPPLTSYTCLLIMFCLGIDLIRSPLVSFMQVKTFISWRLFTSLQPDTSTFRIYRQQETNSITRKFFISFNSLLHSSIKDSVGTTSLSRTNMDYRYPSYLSQIPEIMYFYWRRYLCGYSKEWHKNVKK